MIAIDNNLRERLRLVTALAFDLDGTLLLPGAILSNRAVRALRACRDRGLRVVIATGRAAEAAEPYRAALDVAGPMVCFNGALVADMPRWGVLHAQPLDAAVVDYCVDLSRRLGVYFQAYFALDGARSRLVAETDSPHREMYRQHTGIQAELGDVEAALARHGKAIKGMFLAEPEVHDTLRSRLAERFGAAIYVARTARTFLEVMDARVSKGRGLQVALERLGVAPDQAMAFGDEENDLPMFDAAGLSAAPANAKDAVKARAGLILPSNAEDGVAAFLEDLMMMIAVADGRGDGGRGGGRQGAS